MDRRQNEWSAQFPQEWFLLQMLLCENWRWSHKDLAQLFWRRSWCSRATGVFTRWIGKVLSTSWTARHVSGAGDARHCPFAVSGKWEDNQWCLPCALADTLICFAPEIFSAWVKRGYKFFLMPRTLSGAALIYMCEAGYFGQMQTSGNYPDKLAPVLRRAHRDFLIFKKIHRLSCSQPRFTPSRLNRKQQTCSWFAPS